MFGEFVFPDEEGTRPCFESVSWLQKNFMIWFNKERLRTIITFPVESFALVYKDGKFVDEDSADFVAEEYSRGHSFFTYMSDTVDSLSSCCFDGDTPFMFVEPLNMEEHGGNNAYMVSSIKYAYEKYKDDIINVYHMNFNGTTGKCTGEWVNAKFVKAQAIQEVRIYFKPDDFNPDESRNVMRVTPDHIFPVIDDNGFIRDKNAYLLQTGDQLIFEYAQYMGLFRDEFPDRDQDLVKRAISKVEIVNLDEPKDYYCVELCDKNIEPYFLLPNGNITHNCRLKNKIQTKEFNFTNGNLGIQTGSKSVITLNLSRITQDWFNSVKKTCVTKENVEEHYDELCHYFGDILDRVYKYHTAYNELLWDMYDAGLLPVYKAGFISLNKQYLTIGLNGLNQMAEFLGITCNINPHYEKLCQTIFGYIKQKNQEAAGMFNGHKLTFNTECVPAESLAIKNYNWDKEDGYWVSDDTNLYASYIFKPNDKSLSIFDKITLHGRDYIGDFLDGRTKRTAC